MNQRLACRELLERLSAYLDGDLAAPECHQIDAHCRDCADCRALIQGLRDTMGLCQKAASTPVPASIRRRVRARVRALLADEKGSR